MEIVAKLSTWTNIKNVNTTEPLLRGHPEERPTPKERPLDDVDLIKHKCFDFYP